MTGSNGVCMFKRRWILAYAAMCAASVCLLPAAAGATPMAATAAVTNPAVPVAAAGPTLLVLGDSLSAEYGLARGTGWVALLKTQLAHDGADYTVVNASISGDTTSDGRGRLPALLARLHPALVLLELGANDALRGIPLSVTADNLRFMVDQSQQQHARVLLIGMQIPPNYGTDYTQKFRQLYPQLAQEKHLALVPFLFEGLMTQPQLFQADQMHPTEAAQGILLGNVYPVLKPMLKFKAQPGH
jgi:acyl-CoA thioesterase-1